MAKEIKRVDIGNVSIGAGNPVAIQSMLNVPLANTKKAIAQIKQLTDAGCEIIRAAVPDMQNAEAIKEVVKSIDIPLVADIHFDYRLAIAAIENGVSKVRINPGNIGSRERVRAVCDKLKERNLPVRIGVNSGSLEEDLLKKYAHPCAEALVESAGRSINYFNEFDYDNIVVSIKSSDAAVTYKANMLFREKYSYPLHLGVTEAGSESAGLIRSAVGIGSLLLNNVGETIRVSLTDEPVKEIYAAKEILSACNLRSEGIRIVSCPTCGRTQTDIMPIVKQLKDKTKNIKTPLTVAVMGCVVNGPGEAREADIGVACGKNEGLLFEKGNILYKVSAEDILPSLIKLIEKYTDSEEKK